MTIVIGNFETNIETFPLTLYTSTYTNPAKWNCKYSTVTIFTEQERYSPQQSLDEPGVTVGPAKSHFEGLFGESGSSFSSSEESMSRVLEPNLSRRHFHHNVAPLPDIAVHDSPSLSSGDACIMLSFAVVLWKKMECSATIRYFIFLWKIINKITFMTFSN